MTTSSPNQHFVDVAKSSAKKVENDRKRKATEAAKEQRRKSKCSRNDDTAAALKSYSRHDNALEPDEVTDNVPPEYLAQMKQTFYDTNVVVNREQAAVIERDT